MRDSNYKNKKLFPFREMKENYEVAKKSKQLPSLYQQLNLSMHQKVITFHPITRDTLEK